MHQNNFGAPYFYERRGKFGYDVRIYPSGSEKLYVNCQIINEEELVIPIALGSLASEIADLMNPGTP